MERELRGMKAALGSRNDPPPIKGFLEPLQARPRPHEEHSFADI